MKDKPHVSSIHSRSLRPRLSHGGTSGGGLGTAARRRRTRRRGSLDRSALGLVWATVEGARGGSWRSVAPSGRSGARRRLSRLPLEEMFPKGPLQYLVFSMYTFIEDLFKILIRSINVGRLRLGRRSCGLEAPFTNELFKYLAFVFYTQIRISDFVSDRDPSNQH